MSTARPWVITAPAAALAALQPLLAARAARQPVVVWSDRVAEVLQAPSDFLPPDTEALLVVGSRRHGPRRTLPGLWVRDAAGAAVPIGWIPASLDRLPRFAAGAARVLARGAGIGPLVVLGQWEDRFLRVALRTARWLKQHQPGPRVFQWTADRISRSDLIDALACGPGAAIYYGHGRSNGWAGYHGVRVEHFPPEWGEPLGALLAVCCENASRRGSRLSFAEELVLRGVCAGALAGATKTRHEHNRRLGPALCEALTSGHTHTLASLVAAADVPAGFWDGTPYRFIGDPAAPLVGAAEADARAAEVFAPAPGDPLPPWPDVPDWSPPSDPLDPNASPPPPDHELSAASG
jgi:hypothetical protein